MNSIEILGFTISDDQLLDGNIILNNSMICDELFADEADFSIYYEPVPPSTDRLISSENDYLMSSEGDYIVSNNDMPSLDIGSIPYGTEMVYSHNGNIIGKFYTTKVIQTAKYEWSITAQSAVGLLIMQTHNGGVYSVANGDTIKSVIDEIMSGLNIPYTVSDAIKNQNVAGWLPVASCRDNLQQLCFAFGISILKDVNGDIVFDFNEPDTPEAALVDSQIYAGGTKPLLSPASKVTVYEHAYYAITSNTPVTVFDNTGDTAVTNQKIVFNNPIIVSTLTTTGTITISESGANYAIVSGVGTIEAVEYTHTVKALEQNTGASTIENKEEIFKDATLVNALNSANCLNRVAAYYAQANEVAYDFVAEYERPGELVTYPDPFTDEQKAGLIKQMSIIVSGILKSISKLTDNWLPAYLGNNYSEYELITDGMSWTADRTGTMRFILCGGGQGGQAGQKGDNGTGYGLNQYATTYGGAGGAGGNGGQAGKIYAIDLAVTSGTTYTISIGAGGSGGALNGDLGSNGSDTTIIINGITYTSNDGATPLYGYVNPLTGDIYATQGGSGMAGAKGGDGNNSLGEPGEDLIFEGVTYKGGAIGAYGSLGVGGSGGGAAAGANGGDGYNGGDNATSGFGGPGGSATIAGVGNSGLGGGGNGGHGGGGGGAMAMGRYWGGSGGSGGNGSAGATGSNGFILIYK